MKRVYGGKLSKEKAERKRDPKRGFKELLVLLRGTQPSGGEIPGSPKAVSGVAREGPPEIGIPKLTEEEDVEPFFIMLERVALACKWPEEEWVGR